MIRNIAMLGRDTVQLCPERVSGLCAERERYPRPKVTRKIRL